MNKLQINCFLSVVRNGSFARAATDLYLSAQVVSQHMQHLEKELGVSLFIRSKNGVSLTHDGKEFLQYALQWQSEYSNVQREMQEYYASIATSFKIGVSEYVNVMGAISSGIAAFRAARPLVSMEGEQCKNRILLKKIESGDLDVAIINDLQITAGGNFDYCPFAKEDLRLYISEDIDGMMEGPGVSEEEKKAILREICLSIPRLSTSYGVWSTSDWEEVSHRMSSFLGYDFSTHYETENFRSAMLNLRVLPCSVVCDARFGYIPLDADIFSIPIDVDSRLCCLWHRKNENPLIREFTDHMTQYYA